MTGARLVEEVDAGWSRVQGLFRKKWAQQRELLRKPGAARRAADVLESVAAGTIISGGY